MAEIERAFEAAYARYVREWQQWKAKQIAVSAGLLNLPPEQVTDLLIGFCIGWYGQPDIPEPQIRLDRRFAAARSLLQDRLAADELQTRTPAEGA